MQNGSGRKYPVEYHTWERMRARCYYSKHHRYRHYGGRGIVVCARWKTFKNFLVDMGCRPPGMTLERIDVNGNYEPSNCKWATFAEQRRNLQRSVFVNWQGQRVLLADVCKEVGLELNRVYNRIRALGWDLERALSTPVTRYRKKKELLSLPG